MKRRQFLMTVALLLVLGGAVGPLLGNAAPLQTKDQEFNAFWKSFKLAVARNNKEAVADMTKLPFMLDSKNEDRAGFLKHYDSLFTRKMKRCFASAKPLQEGDYYEIFCGEQIFLFAKDTDGKYKFVDIGVND